MPTLRIGASLAALGLGGLIASPLGAGADPGAGVVRADSPGCFLMIAGGVRYPCTEQVVMTPEGRVNVWLKGTVPGGYLPDHTLHVDNASTGQTCDPAAPLFDGVVTRSGNVEIHCRQA